MNTALWVDKDESREGQCRRCTWLCRLACIISPSMRVRLVAAWFNSISPGSIWKPMTQAHAIHQYHFPSSHPASNTKTSIQIQSSTNPNSSPPFSQTHAQKKVRLLISTPQNIRPCPLLPATPLGPAAPRGSAGVELLPHAEAPAQILGGGTGLGA